MDNLEDEGIQQMSIEEKRQKIASNYDTIKVLRERLDESKGQQKIGMTRAAYIRMIFDVTRKVDELNDEINKMVQEMRHLQRDISNLSGRLDRSFAQVEETILKNAKNDGWSRECYRLLGIMHENCDQLILAVQETGELTREIRQLEDQIGQVKVARAYSEA